MKVLILHAYSADNLGDGLLVRESLDIVEKSCGHDCDITIAASHPETFVDLGYKIVDSSPKLFGFNFEYLRTLRQIKSFDLVLAVGGGYLRAGSFTEALKTLLVHGPQLFASSRRSTATVYLPQSIGPMKFGLRGIFAHLLRRTSAVMLRDDRSVIEFHDVPYRRLPDLAVADVGPGFHNAKVNPVPVLSIRAINGVVPPAIYQLEVMLNAYDSYIQSTTGGNDDTAATNSLNPQKLIGRKEFLEQPTAPPRVVIAVRLHAALMAMRAGHYVIHLAYERKGFGAFQDLGISDYVHNVNSFDPKLILDQANELIGSEEARLAYRANLAATYDARQNAKNQCVQEIRQAVSNDNVPANVQ